ncbi:MAG: type III-A CRISPR-associated protein Csm2 [Tepidisphaeraceae bacterium]
MRPRQNEPPRSGGGYGGGGGGQRPGGFGAGDRDRSQPDQTVAQLWPGYLEGGYFDDKGCLQIQYVSRCIPGDELLPDRQQKGLESIVREMANGRPALTTGQLRRFFMHCRGIETKLKSGADWTCTRPQFTFIDSAASDAHGKQPQKIPGLFYDFIRRNVNAVKTEQDFLRGFIPHFEALVGFGSLYIQKERN